jgi:hypothetical protein
MFALIVPVLAALCLMAYTPNVNEAQDSKKELQNEKVITVDKSIYDFGTIKQDDGNVSTVFTIINNTNAPILLTNVTATCGCTTPNWTKEPIEPGKTGQVTVTYSPKGRPGPFEKVVTITTSGEPEKLSVRIKGIVE